MNVIKNSQAAASARAGNNGQIQSQGAAKALSAATQINFTCAFI